jgi:hypothetical protein
MNVYRFAVPLIAMLVSGLFGAILVVIADVSLRRARRSQSWPVAGAIVYQSLVEKHAQGDPASLHADVFEPVIQYKYTLMGRQYTGKRIFFGSSTTNQTAAEEILSHYLPGMPVLVHYDPRDPAQSVLEPRAPAARSMRNIGLVSLTVGVIASIILAFIVLSSIL